MNQTNIHKKYENIKYMLTKIKEGRNNNCIIHFYFLK